MKNAPTAIRFRVSARSVHPTPTNSQSIMVYLRRHSETHAEQPAPGATILPCGSTFCSCHDIGSTAGSLVCRNVEELPACRRAVRQAHGPGRWTRKPSKVTYDLYVCAPS